MVGIDCACHIPEGSELPMNLSVGAYAFGVYNYLPRFVLTHYCDFFPQIDEEHNLYVARDENVARDEDGRFFIDCTGYDGRNEYSPRFSGSEFCAEIS
jgi:hypothetical protein